VPQRLESLQGRVRSNMF